jgi:iron complex outermembrane receptor protein
MSILFRAALGAALLLPACGPALAQEAQQNEPVRLEAVEVRTTRPRNATTESADEARERLGERAGATAVVDARAYRDGRASTLADALGYAPGVFVQPRFGAGEARLSIRGSGLQRTFHGRGIALLQDGSPLNLADGSFDFQAVEPLAARYIEVWRGANALEYGAATLGGAVNFVSPTGAEAPRFDARMESGSFGYRRTQVAMAGEEGRSDGYLSVTGFSQDGFRDHARQETYRLFGNVGWQSGVLDGRAYVTHVETRSELPGDLTLEQALNEPRSAAAGSVALDQRRDFRLDRLATRLAWTPAGGASVVLSAYYADKSLDHPIFQVLRQRSRDAGFDMRWRGEGSVAGLRDVLVAGIAYARGTVDDDRFANLGGRAGARTNRFEQEATTAKAYAEYQLWVDPRWVLSLGAQALRASRESRDAFVTGGIDESFDAGYGGISPKLGVRYRYDDHAQWFANVSRSLEPPTFAELSGGPGITQVDAQRATSAETGVRVQRGDFRLDAALYRARVHGELLSLSDGAGNPLGTVNAGETLHQGLELGLRWQFAAQWTWSLNGLWNDFRFANDAVYGDNDLAGVPPVQLRTQLRWSRDGQFYLAPNLQWVPDGGYIDHANSFEAPGFTVFGVRAGGELGAGWSWFVDARNLADKRWIATPGVLADARGQDQAAFLPGDGRAVYAGLEWKLR